MSFPNHPSDSFKVKLMYRKHCYHVIFIFIYIFFLYKLIYILRYIFYSVYSLNLSYHLHFYPSIILDHKLDRSSNSLLIIIQLVSPMPRSRIEDFNEIKHFHHIDFMTTPYHNNPYHWGQAIYNFGITFLCHHYYIFSFLIYVQQKRRFLKKWTIFHVLLIGPCHSTRTSALVVMKFTLLVDPSFAIITINSVCLIL